MKHRAIKHLLTIALVLGLSALLVDPLYAGTLTNTRMSDVPEGPEITHFPSGTTIVYVVFDYADMESEEIVVRVFDTGGGVLFDQATTYTGSGIESIEVLGPEGGVFPDGQYLTKLYGGPFPLATIIWQVGEVTTPTPTATNTPTTTPTPTSTVIPLVDVSPTEGYAGQEFTFTGSDFTPGGLVHEGFRDPDQEYHYTASFHADSSGGFLRTITSESDWLLGVYTYIASDAEKSYDASVQFTVSEPLPTATATATPTSTPTPTGPPGYKIYLPLIMKQYRG
jgi:hypothetical protein